MDLAHAATIKFGSACYGSNEQTCPWAGDSSRYYKCANSFSYSSCSNFAGVWINYTGTNGGAGTSANPYILTGCSFKGCLCSEDVVYTSSGCGGTCSYGLRPVPATATGEDRYHQNTTCDYCGYNQYKYTFYPAANVTVTQCYSCPNGGTSNGTGDITSCCVASGWTASDTTGTFTCGTSSCYSN